MRLTTRGRYAVTAALDVALHGPAPTPLLDVAARQSIPAAYLRQLFAQLCRCGLLVSRRGRSGGYALARPASEISLLDVIAAVNEGVSTVRCGGSEDCQDNRRCLTHTIWARLDRRLREMLDAVKLSDWLSDAGVKAVAERQDRMLGHGRLVVAPLRAAKDGAVKIDRRPREVQ